jgi:hypothetical protein
MDKAIYAVQKAIGAIDNELGVIELPETGPESRKQLTEFKQILERMLRNLNGAEPVTLSDRSGYGLGRIIVDSWNFSSFLGEIVINAEHVFLKALQDI